MREYFHAYHSMLEAMRKLSDAEVGRLFRGLLYYSMTKEQPDNLQGREELLFDVFSQTIDREIEKYDEKCKTNRRNATSRTQSLPVATSRTQEKEKDKDKEEEKDKDKDNKDYMVVRFEDFWKVYPNKVKKGAAKTAWRAGKLDGIADRIIDDVNKRCDTEWTGDGAQFVPHPTTYLHQRRWEDETPPQERKGRAGWHNPALDYQQRGSDGKVDESGTHIWTAEELEGLM